MNANDERRVSMRDKAEQSTSLARARSVARWLDARYLDPIVGLFAPGVGDLATAGFGLYLVAIAVRQRLPALVIARMLLNLGFDALLGSIPGVGDIFDFLFRANQKNLLLLEARYETRAYTAGDVLVVLGALLLLLGALVVPIWLVVTLFRSIF
jgi:hypothetical protein